MNRMTNRDIRTVDEKEWRRLCDLIASEPDPRRLSQLVDQLLNALEARRKEMREKEGGAQSTADNQ
jgi:hypothetical protein